MTPDVDSWPLPKYLPAHRHYMYMHIQTYNPHTFTTPKVFLTTKYSIFLR